MFQSTGENGDKNEDEDGLSNKGPVNVKRSPSILSKLAKYKDLDFSTNYFINIKIL